MEPFPPGVLLPTDFSEASRVAFAHALAIALAQRSRLTLLNVREDLPTAEEGWERFPPVRQTLERWGLLEPGSSRADVYRQLAVKVKKVAVDADDPAGVIADYLNENPNDLLVLAVEQQRGRPHFLEGSEAQRVALRAGIDALFVPSGSHGFVSLEDGTLSLRRILVPVDHTPDPGPAIDAATWAAHWLGSHPVEILLLHVGDAMPQLRLPEQPESSEWKFTQELRQGDAVEQILEAAREHRADLLLMSTDGRDGFLDVFRGSHSERVLRQAPCPVGAIPTS